MAVPNAPTELGGAKVLFLVYDNSGSNAAALLRAVGNKTINGTITSHLGVATHEDGATVDSSTDQIVAMGGFDRGTNVARAVIVDPSGRVIARPLLAYDGGAAIAFAHPRLIGAGAAVHGEQVGHQAIATHIGGATFTGGTDPLVVAGGQTGAHVATPLLTDAAGRLLTDRDLVLAGTGARSIATTGTAVALKASSTPCRKLLVRPHYDNTGTIFIGISTVTTGRAVSTGGLELRPGDAPLTIEATDLANVFINGTNVNSTRDGVSFMWWT